MAADRLAGDIRGCCARNGPEQMASSEKLMLYINTLELHEWITTISPFLFLVPPANTPACNETHKRKRDTKAARVKERSLLGWPFWILSKGIASRYGDLENSPCSLIPLLFLQAKGIQWKLIPWTPGLTLLFLLDPDKNVAVKIQKKNQWGEVKEE